MAFAARLLGDFKPRQSGHLDVEEKDVGRVFGERTERSNAVLGLGDYCELGPEFRQRLTQFGAQDRLVLGEHGSQGLQDTSAHVRSTAVVPRR